MPLGLSIFLAANEGSALDVVIWLVAGALWLFLQMKAARKKQPKKTHSAPAARAPAASSGGDSPSPDELADIFKRLGADIPRTPPPAPRPSAAPSMPRRSGLGAPLRKPAARITPALAQRLAQAKREAEAAAREAETVRRDEEFAANAIIPGVQSRAGEHRALDTATRHTGAILPRLYAMSMHLTRWPTLPIPGFGPPHQVGPPLRPKLHSRREVRDGLIAQLFLQPPKDSRTCRLRPPAPPGPPLRFPP